MERQKRNDNFWPLSVPLALLGVCILTYGLLITRLGLYWDDWPTVWFFHLQGAPIFNAVFASDRPLLGRLFMVTMPFLGDSLLKWQLFSLIIRWLLAVAVWWTFRKLWPGYELSVAFIALLSAVYPGFLQQWIAITYGHALIPYISFIVSLGLMIWALRKPGWFWHLLILSILTDAFPLFLNEYYFGLELLRPIIIWLVLRESKDDNTWKPKREQLWKVGLNWVPFVVLMCLFIIWRIFIQEFSRAQITIFNDLSHDFVGAGLQLLKTILQDVLVSSFGAWSQVFQLTKLLDFNSSLSIWGLLLSLLTVFLTAFYLIRLNKSNESSMPTSQGIAYQMIGLGCYALIVAGIPAWATSLHVRLGFHLDRFTLSMMIGASLLFVGMLELWVNGRNQKIIIVSVMVGLAAGFHYGNAATYQQDWETQRSFFWQMVWRMPGIKPGTTLVTSGWPFLYYTDNSLTAPLNWIYDPNNTSLEMSYLLVDLPTRLGSSIANLEKNVPIRERYRATTFAGNTSQLIVYSFDGVGCFRVLDPKIDNQILRYPDPLYEALPLSRLDLITGKAGDIVKLPRILYPEPGHDWCFYYEQAALAAQSQDWQKVVELAAQAQEKGYFPTLPTEHASEYLPFIESYAHLGYWQKAQNLTRHASTQSAYALKNALCSLWMQIEKTTSTSDEQKITILEVQRELNCQQP